MDEIREIAALVERLRGPMPSVYVPFGDGGDLAWDGVLSRERQLRERREAADEIDRLWSLIETLRGGLLTLATHLGTACNVNAGRTYCWTHECELTDETICVGEAARQIVEAMPNGSQVAQ